jgi:hypothetical protein
LDHATIINLSHYPILFPGSGSVHDNLELELGQQQ